MLYNKKSNIRTQSRNVVIERNLEVHNYKRWCFCKEIELEDALENIGAQMVKEVASKTAGMAGDGTTTAVLNSDYIIWTKKVKVKPMDLKRN